MIFGIILQLDVVFCEKKVQNLGFSGIFSGFVF